MPIRNVYDNGIPDNDPDQNPDSSVFLKTIKPYREFKAEKRLAKALAADAVNVAAISR